MDAHTDAIVFAFASYEEMGHDPKSARLDDLVYECDQCDFTATTVYDAAAHSYGAPVPGEHLMYPR